MDRVPVTYDCQDFDRFAARLLFAWEAQAEEYLRDWSSMHPEEQLIHAADFGVNETHFGHLRDYAESHDLTADQERQYERLFALRKRNRPRLKKLGFMVK
jgi:hypothetical protein